MANQTVYPYGTNGKLPSSVGLVNDLYTGGADKALTAEQGKAIADDLFSTQLDLSGLTASVGIIVDGVWAANSPSTCIFVPVSPGKRYRLDNIDPNNENHQMNYAFLKGWGVGANASTPAFATGYSDRVIEDYGARVWVTAPDDATVLYLRKTQNDGGYTLPLVYEWDTSINDRIDDLSGRLMYPVSLDELPIHSIAIGYEKKWHSILGTCVMLPVTPGHKYILIPRDDAGANFAMLKDVFPGSSATEPNWATGFTDRITILPGCDPYIITAPEDAKSLYIRLTDSYNTNMTPTVYTESRDDTLLRATFNSSFNEIDTTPIREKFCSKLDDVDEVETFLFFTDPHLTPESRYENMNEELRNKYISTLQKYYNSLPLDFCICGGDWLNFKHTVTEAKAWLGYCDGYMRKLFRNYLPVFGNHDNNPYNPNTNQTSWLNALTYKEMENLVFRENKGTYYSHEAVNTRFYVLNSGVSFIKEMTNSTYSRLVNNRWPQVDWLGQRLLSEDPAHGIIILHIYSNAGNETDWFSTATGYWAKGIHAFGANVKAMAIAYNNRQSITLNGNTYDFSNCEGSIAFIMCGHTHFDYVDTSGELPIVCCTNLEGGYLDGNEIKYTLTPTFDNCVVDYDDGVLYMVRVGAAKSRIVHFVPQSLSTGSTLELDTELTGTVTWASRDTAKATVSNGTVTGVASGIVGIKASDDTTEEYWIIKVS